jgi:hypothetical protein
MALFPSPNMSSWRSTVGYLKCSTAEGALTVHTSVRTAAGWEKREQALEPGACLQLNFAKILIGPLGYSDGRRPDTRYMRRAGKPRAEDAPGDYEIGFSVPVHVPRIGWLDWTSSSRYLKPFIEYLYNNHWEAVENRKDTLSVTFTGFATHYNKQYSREYYVPNLQPNYSSPKSPLQSRDPSYPNASASEPSRTASVPKCDRPNGDPDDGISF